VVLDLGLSLCSFEASKATVVTDQYQQAAALSLRMMACCFAGLSVLLWAVNVEICYVVKSG
jgi:hypothetical protein